MLDLIILITLGEEYKFVYSYAGGKFKHTGSFFR
jgi:hypothetical protein